MPVTVLSKGPYLIRLKQRSFRVPVMYHNHWAAGCPIYARHRAHCAFAFMLQHCRGLKLEWMTSVFCTVALLRAFVRALRMLRGVSPQPAHGVSLVPSMGG